MKIGSKVTNNVVIKKHDRNTLVGQIIGIGQCLNCTCNGDYMVNRYDVDWGTFRDWHLAKSLKTIKYKEEVTP